MRELITKLSRAWEGLGLPIPFDKVLHFVVCLILAIISSFFTDLVMIVPIAAGVGKELYDLYDYGLFSWKDILYDLLGCGIVQIIVLM